MTEVQHRSVIVTGGGSGIGRACCLRFAAEGGKVLVVDSREDGARETTAQVLAAGGEANWIRCDVSNEGQVVSMVAQAISLHGGLDVLVASAGTSSRAVFHNLTLADWELVLRTNLTGTFLCCREAVRYMMHHGGGNIVTIGSVQSVVVSGGGPASYRASKAGILMLTRSIGAEYAEFGIRANCVCPAGVATSMQRHIEEQSSEWTSEQGPPLRRWMGDPPISRAADPGEIAAVVAFLASDDASIMTAAAVMADGGYTAV